MTITGRIREWIARAFRVGPAAVDWWAGDQGKADWDATNYQGYVTASPTAYACLRVRSEALAGIPYRLHEGAERTPIVEHPLLDLLAKVNPHWTWSRLIDATEMALGTWGKAFWIAEGRGPRYDQPPQELWWVSPERMRPRVSAESYLTGWVYEANGRRIEFDAREVIWFRYPNPWDEFDGLSPLLPVRPVIEAMSDAMASNRDIFRNGLQPGGIISPADKDTYLTADQRRELEDAINLRLRGRDRRHRTMVLSAAVKFETPKLTPVEAEFINLLNWGVAEICKVYKVPPTKVQDFSRATYSNVEQADKALYTDCLIPEARMLAAEITEQLLPMFGLEGARFEFDFSGAKALQEDMTEITSQMVQLTSIGVPLNRLLQVMRPELLPTDAEGYPWGDGPSASPPPPPADQSTAGLAAEAARILAAYQAKAIGYGSEAHLTEMRAFDDRTRPWERRFAVLVADLMDTQRQAILDDLAGGIKALDPREPFDRDAADAEFADAALPLMRDVQLAAGASALRRVGVAIDFSLDAPGARRALQARAQRFAREVNRTTWTLLKTSLAEGMAAGESVPDLEARVNQVMGERIRSSAETIARTEVVSAYNEGTVEGYRQSGIVAQKTWLAALDDRTRDAHVALHGQTVELDGEWAIDGATAGAPGQFGVAELDINCRCTTVPVVGSKAVAVLQVGSVNGKQ